MLGKIVARRLCTGISRNRIRTTFSVAAAQLQLQSYLLSTLLNNDDRHLELNGKQVRRWARGYDQMCGDHESGVCRALVSFAQAAKSKCIHWHRAGKHAAEQRCTRIDIGTNACTRN